MGQLWNLAGLGHELGVDLGRHSAIEA